MDRVLVVAAHPDDDILGCGATMARWATEGQQIRVIALAEGVTSRLDQPETVAQRRAAAHRALAAVGVSDSAFYDFPDQRLDTVPLLDLAKAVSDEVDAYGPDTVITHSPSDLNLDHRIAFEATSVACRPQPGSTVRRVLHFEVPSATGWRFAADRFTPTFWVNVAGTKSAKLAALDCYGPEIKPWPHVRSLEAIEALMAWRGASVGVSAAEAFEVSLWIQD